MFWRQKKYWLAFLLFSCAGMIYSAAVFATQLDRDSYGTIHGEPASANFEINNRIADPAVGRVTSSNYILEHYYTLGTTTVSNHCTNSILDSDEVQIDCGGSTCQSCTFHCSNSIKDYDETGIDCGGAFCSSCGGGGGGGGGGGTVLAQVSFVGKAAPNASITILRDGILVSTGISTATGDFNIVTGNLSTGNYHFTIYYEDSAGRRSASLIVDTSITQQGQVVIVNNILLPPTLDTDKLEVARGETITIFGETAPGAEITLSVIGGDGSESIYHTTASASGNYQFVLNTSALALGQYSIKVRAILGTMQSEYTAPLIFTVGEETIIKEPEGACPKKADLNNDCRVNLVDFSIAAYWFKREISPSFSSIEALELNGDGLINLTDFSILAYYWTG